MASSLLAAGKPMPQFKLPLVGGGEVTIGENLTSGKPTLFSMYRGLHCPLCKKYNIKMEEGLPDLDSLGVDLVFASMNDQAKAEQAKAEWDIKSKVAYSMTEEQAKSLGLYVSNAMVGSSEPAVFSEAGMFMLNKEGVLQFVDVSNAPFLRPDLTNFMNGLKYVLAKSYPIRGTR